MPRMAVLGLLTVVGLLSPPFAQAQEIRWRKDYAAARKESAATGKPMLLDFGTATCIFCRKLDATTFRDRGVVELVNTRFIPVKLDGERDGNLAQSVGIQAYPTILLVTADGKIVERHEGFADTTKMMALLRHVPVSAGPNSVSVPRSPALELLSAARADHAAGRYMMCLQKCDRLATEHASSAASAEARRLSAGIAADPQKWKQVTAQLEGDFAAAKRDLEAALKHAP